MPESQNLRPIEAVMLRLKNEGHSTPQIASRLGKKPGTVDRIFEMIDHKDDAVTSTSRSQDGPRPLERVISRLRDEGESYGEIGNRLGRSGAQIRRIENLSNLKKT